MERISQVRNFLFQFRVAHQQVLVAIDAVQQGAQSHQVRDPFNEAAVFVQRDDSIRPDVQVPLTGVRISNEVAIDELIKLHQPEILAQVVLGFAEEDVLFAVRAA